MCSIGEDDFGDEGGLHAMQNDFINLKVDSLKLGEICKKCENDRTVVKIDFREAECKECFLAYVRHKFRAALGISKVLPKNADILLIVDGNQESVALLDMLHYALNQDNFKRLRCNAKVLYIDDNFLYKEFNYKIEDIEEILKNYNLESYIISLTSLNGGPMEFDQYQQLNLNNEENAFMNIVENIQNLTSKQDFILKTQRNLIRSVAKNLNCQFIFLSDISSDLATTFLINTSLGAGASVAYDISLLDDRISDIQIIRPIKDLNKNEISNYIQLNNLKYYEKPNYGERNNSSSSSIQNLTREFIRDLQQNFPSTVSTIFRTGEKIAASSSNRKNKNKSSLHPIRKQIEITNSEIVNGSKNDLIENHITDKKCRFCYSKLDNSNSLEAIKFSKLVSTNVINNLDIKNIKKINLDEFESNVPYNLCHACRNIIQDSTHTNIIS